MVTEELIATIEDKYRQGIRRKEIREQLYNQGWPEEDIDAALTKVQHDAYKKLPIISSIYQLIDHFEAKKSLTTPQMTVVLMAGCVGLLLLIAVGLYFILDPLDTRSIGRDKQRETDVAKLRTAITAYYKENDTYPRTLQVLVPDFLQAVPQDPQSGAPYNYTSLDGASNFELCVSFEIQPVQCIHAEPINSVIPIIPTATLQPEFVPQSASNPANVDQSEE